MVWRIVTEIWMSAPSISRLLPPVETVSTGRRDMVRGTGRDMARDVDRDTSRTEDDPGRAFTLPTEERSRSREAGSDGNRSSDRAGPASEGRAAASRKPSAQQVQAVEKAETGKDEDIATVGEGSAGKAASAADQGVAGKAKTEREAGPAVETGTAVSEAGAEVAVAPVTTPLVIAQIVAPALGGGAKAETETAAGAGQVSFAGAAAGSVIGPAGKETIAAGGGETAAAKPAAAASAEGGDAAAKPKVDTAAQAQAKPGEAATAASAIGAQQAGTPQATGDRKTQFGAVQMPSLDGAAAGEAGETSAASATSMPNGGTRTEVATAKRPASSAAATVASAQNATGEAGEAVAAPQAAGGAAPAEKSGQAGEAAPVKAAVAKIEGSTPDAAQAGAQQQSAAAPVVPVALPRPVMMLPELDPALQASQAHQNASAEMGRATPLHVVPVEIGMRALAGNRQFDIRLDPGELGRVDVRLDISEDGEVSARLTVDRVETLQLLQRDARTLERAFEQAGLKTSEGGVQIGLRDPSDQPGSRQGGQQDDAPARNRRIWAASGDETSSVTTPVETVSARRVARVGGVDLSI